MILTKFVIAQIKQYAFNCEGLFKRVYKATIINGDETNDYHGSTKVSFKKRYTQHKHSFKSDNKPHHPNT